MEIEKRDEMKNFNKKQLYSIFSLISLLILTFLFRKLLFGSYSFIGPDSLSPQAIKQGIELIKNKTGEYPLWLPWVFSGLPSVHSFQNISDFYYPHYIYKFLNNYLGVQFIWNYIVHFIFGGLGCVLLLKRFKVDNFSAIFGGLAFMLTPYLTTMVVHGHGSQMMTSVYIPWTVWAVHRLLFSPNYHNIGILALIVGLQLQRAHVQIAYYTWMLIGLYITLILFNQIRLVNGKKKLRTIAKIIIGLLIGLGLSLSIYIPAIEYSSFSTRAGSSGGAGLEYATQWSFSILELGTFIMPSFVGFGGITYWGNMPFTDYPNYMGLIILILSIIGAFKSKISEKKLFILAILFSFMLSLGKNFSLFYGLFYDYFPFFKKFRVPVMILILLQFSVSILSGFGLNHLRKNVDNYDINSFLKKILLTTLSISLMMILFGKDIILKFLPRNDLINRFGLNAQQTINEIRFSLLYNELKIIFIMIILVSFIIYLYKNKIHKWSLIAISITLISIFDLSYVNYKIIEPSEKSYRSSTLSPSVTKKRYLNDDEIIRFLKKDTSNFRILPTQPLDKENRWSAFNIQSIYGYHPAKLNNYNEFMNDVGFSNPNILQMLNVKYLITFQQFDHDSFEKVFTGKLYHNNKYNNANVYLFKHFIDRAFFVEKLQYIENDDVSLKFLENNRKSFIRESFINEDLDLKIFTGIGKIKFVKSFPNEIVLETNSNEEQFLVLSEVYYPSGWKAYVNDKESKIFKVNSLLRGVKLPRGNNVVRFEFYPRDVKLGSTLSIISLLIIILLISSILFTKNEK